MSAVHRCPSNPVDITSRAVALSNESARLEVLKIRLNRSVSNIDSIRSQVLVFDHGENLSEVDSTYNFMSISYRHS